MIENLREIERNMLQRVLRQNNLQALAGDAQLQPVHLAVDGADAVLARRARELGAGVQMQPPIVLDALRRVAVFESGLRVLMGNAATNSWRVVR